MWDVALVLILPVNRVWDAQDEGFLVMYLWQQLLGKLYLILNSD